MFRFSLKRYSAILFLFALSVFIPAAQADEPQEFAPVSDIFKNWTKPDNSQSQSIVRVKSDSDSDSDSETSLPYYNGLIPSPIDRSTLWDNPPVPESENTSGIVRVKAASQYSITSLPAIRSQSPWGTCWAHAALGSLESNIIARYKINDINLSEFHLAYFVYGDSRAGKSFGKYDNDDILDQGGNSDMAIAFLSRAGTVKEATLAYPSSTTKKYTAPAKLPEEYASSGYFLKEGYTLGPSGAEVPSDTVINTIKDLVAKNGAVYISYYAGSGAYSANSSVYVYYDKTQGSATNHAVCIVGWNDAFDKSNFANTTSKTPSKNGAWLVRNSWGYSWGDNGYFWMPYEQPIANISQFITDEVDKDLKTYCYDDLGMTSATSYLYGANIFKADDDEIFQYIGFYTRFNNEDVELTVYDLGTSVPFSPVPGSSTGQAGSYVYGRNFNVPYAGYHTEDFISRAKKIAKGHYFSVVMKFSSWTPIEKSAKWANGQSYASPVCNTGESYISYDGLSWSSSSNNVCIKAFTIKDPNAENSNSLTISGTLPDGVIGQSYSATLTASGGTGSYTWTYTGGAPGLKFAPSGAAANITGTPTKAGTYDAVTVTVKDSNNSTFTQIYTVKISENNTFEIDGSLPARGSKNNYYYGQLSALGGTAPYTWSFADKNAVPPGLVIPASGSTVEVTGITTSIGTYSFTVNVKDSKGLTASKTFDKIIISSTPEKQLSFYGTSNILTSGTAGTSYQESLFVTGGVTLPCHFYSTGDLPPGLTLAEGKAQNFIDITGIPTTPGTYTFTLYAVDANNYPASKTFSLTINPTTSSSLVINGTLSNGVTGTSYTGSLLAAGGNGTHTWSISSGSLPPGLKLSSSGTTGTISGTPTTAGSYTFTLQVKDSSGLTATQSYTVIITAPALSLTGSFPNASAGVSYTGTLTASGGSAPYTWKLSSGNLPKGLALDSSTGKVTGIPTASGTYSFAVQVTDSEGSTASKTFSIKVTGTVLALTINGSLVTTGYEGSSYSGELRAGGGIAPYTWKYSGNLPTGLNFTSSGTTAKLTGTPSATGQYTFTVNLSDSIGTTISKIYTLNIQKKQTLNINAAFINSTKGAKYSKNATVTGGTAPYTWSYSGKLPSGLRMALSNKNGTGVTISGTTSAAGTFTFTLKAKDKNGLTGEKMFTVSVTQLTLTGAFTSGAAKMSYSSKITASGGITPYKWAYSGKIPTGLKLSYSGADVTLSGTPTVGGKFTFTLKLTDNNKITISKSFTVVIASAPTINGTFGAASAGKKYTSKATVSGGTSPYTWSYSGTLPPELKLTSSGTTATVSGTPTTAGRYTFTIKLTDKNGVSASKSFTITVTKPVISGAFAVSGTLNKSYSSSIRASGGTSPYKWAKSSGTYPIGLKFSYSGSTAKLTGKPTRAGEYTFTIKVTDKNGGIDTKSFTITIPSAASNNKSAASSSPSITGALANGTVKKYYSQSIKATGGTASYTWTKSAGTLPTGLKLLSSGSTARIYGTPSKAGTFSFTLKVTDKNKKTATKKFTMKIAAASTAKTTAKSSSSSIAAKTAVIAVPNSYSGSTNNNYIHVNKIMLDVVKSENIIAIGSGQDEDLITVKAGKPITFNIGEYQDTNGKKAVLSDLRVFVDFKYDKNIIITESQTFTVPAELVKGDFTVSVKGVYQGLEAESEEFYIEAQ